LKELSVLMYPFCAYLSFILKIMVGRKSQSANLNGHSVHTTRPQVNTK